MRSPDLESGYVNTIINKTYAEVFDYCSFSPKT